MTTRTYKNGPVAKGLRTFNKAMAGVVAGLMAINWFTDWKLGLTTLTLGAAAALIAGVAAGLLALSKFQTTTPLQRAAAQFVEHLGGGLIALPALHAIDKVAVYSYAHGIGRVAVAAACGAVLTLLTNASEDSGA